jgi:hypothetical protein
MGERLMKYIRTKYGIISSLKTVRTSDIVRKADTIEELCDEFICDKFVHNNLKELLEFGELGKFIGGTIYGAIWTDKGLIYVAKMNDKGELELL